MVQCKHCLKIVITLLDRILLDSFGKQYYFTSVCYECNELFSYLFRLQQDDIKKKDLLGFDFFKMT